MSRLSKALVAVAAAAAVALGAELVQRARLDWTRSRAEQELAGLRSEALGRMPFDEDEGVDLTRELELAGRAWSVSPYVGFDFENAGRLLTRDLRRQDAAPPDSFTILVLGGSVAANFAFLGRERLFELLRQDPRLAERPLSLYMYARPSHKQPQQLLQAGVLFSAGLRPDLVLNLDGFNEVAIAGRNVTQGLHPLQPSAGQWLTLLSGAASNESLLLTARAFERREALLASVEATEASPWLSSALVGPALLRGVRARRDASLAAADALARHVSEQGEVPAGLVGPTPPEGPAILRTCVDIWSESSVSLAGLCAARGIPYVHVLQPTLHDAGSKPLTEEERRTGAGPQAWVEAARTGYPLLREAGAGLSKRGVSFCDASRVFAALEEPVYYDVCHFREPGHLVLAEAVAAAILRALP